MDLTSFNRLWTGLKRRVDRSAHDRQILKLAVDIDLNSPVPEGEPVIFFNASTRLSGMSLNAAYALLSSWSLRLAGVPVVYYYCQSGLPLCVLGTRRQSVTTPPPCAECIKQSRVFYSGGDAIKFDGAIDAQLVNALQKCSVSDLMNFVYHEVPLGELVLPSVRWVLRRHHLEDNQDTRHVFKQYIQGAWNIYITFSALLDEVSPQAVVVFNGMSYPEATARWVVRHRGGIRVITHEVCLQPFSAFFTPGDATLRTIDIPEGFELDEEQNDRLDAYLEERFKGNFKMAGVKFWPEMETLNKDFETKVSTFKQMVPVFANVIFDTSQAHANVIFKHMFDWLDTVKTLALQHPDTLFVLRAHPDEARPGKESRENVAGWVKKTRFDQLPNVIFVDSNKKISSYDLIRRSKFVMVYNSTIGLEASLMGAAVLCAGRSRFTDYPTVFFPTGAGEFNQMADTFLNSENIKIPQSFQSNARRYLYYELFHASLPFGDFLQEDQYWHGYVTLKHFNWDALLPENSATMNAIYEGIILDRPFLLK